MSDECPVCGQRSGLQGCGPGHVYGGRECRTYIKAERERLKSELAAAVAERDDLRVLHAEMLACGMAQEEKLVTAGARAETAEAACAAFEKDIRLAMFNATNLQDLRDSLDGLCDGFGHNNPGQPYLDAMRAVKLMRDAMLAVLCDPEGNPCFAGSDGDRQVIADCLEQAAKAAGEK